MLKNKIVWLVLALALLGVAFLLTGKESKEGYVDTTEGVTTVIETDSAPAENTSFFITSVNPGEGANFGGLAGADGHCQLLADNAGLGEKTWRAYLSAPATDSSEVEHARNRIGEGPWYNHKGEQVAESIDDLHGNNTINKTSALDENGNEIAGKGDKPNRHDILTGTGPDGLLASGDGDVTCSAWTSGLDGSAVVGHHDRLGLDDSDEAKSWNSSHGSRGCSLENLNSTGGDGLIYCFAL